jgi:hypothetical protein
MANELRKKVTKAIKAKNKEVYPGKRINSSSAPKGVSVKTADIVAKRTRGNASAVEKLDSSMYNTPRNLTAAEGRAAKVIQGRRNQDLKKTAARGVGILKTQAKKKAASNAKKAIGG